MLTIPFDELIDNLRISEVEAGAATTLLPLPLPPAAAAPPPCGAFTVVSALLSEPKPGAANRTKRDFIELKCARRRIIQ